MIEKNYYDYLLMKSKQNNEIVFTRNPGKKIREFDKLVTFNK
jgi:hypothetical protein